MQATRSCESGPLKRAKRPSLSQEKQRSDRAGYKQLRSQLMGKLWQPVPMKATQSRLGIQAAATNCTHSSDSSRYKVLRSVRTDAGLSQARSTAQISGTWKLASSQGCSTVRQISPFSARTAGG